MVKKPLNPKVQLLISVLMAVVILTIFLFRYPDRL